MSTFKVTPDNTQNYADALRLRHACRKLNYSMKVYHKIFTQLRDRVSDLEFQTSEEKHWSSKNFAFLETLCCSRAKGAFFEAVSGLAALKSRNKEPEQRTPNKSTPGPSASLGELHSLNQVGLCYVKRVRDLLNLIFGQLCPFGDTLSLDDRQKQAILETAIDFCYEVGFEKVNPFDKEDICKFYLNKRIPNHVLSSFTSVPELKDFKCQKAIPDNKILIVACEGLNEAHTTLASFNEVAEEILTARDKIIAMVFEGQLKPGRHHWRNQPFPPNYQRSDFPATRTETHSRSEGKDKSPVVKSISCPLTKEQVEEYALIERLFFDSIDTRNIFLLPYCIQPA